MAKAFQETLDELRKIQKALDDTKKDARELAAELRKVNPKSAEDIKKQQTITKSLLKSQKDILILKEQERQKAKQLREESARQVKQELLKTAKYREQLLAKERLKIQERKITESIRQQARQMEGLNRKTNTWGAALSSFPAKFNTIGNIIGNTISRGISTITSQMNQFISGSIEAFQVQEKAVRASDMVFGEFSKNIQQTAADVQKITTVGDEAYIRLAVQANNFGVEQDKVNEVTQGAIGLAQKFEAAGLSQETALKGLALAYSGDFTQLQRYIPALKSATSESEKLRIVKEAMNDGFLQAQDFAKSETGQLIQQQNAIGDLQEEIGKKLIPVKSALLKLTKNLITFLLNNGDALLTLVKSFVMYKVAITGTTRVMQAFGKTSANISKVSLGLIGVFVALVPEIISFGKSMFGASKASQVMSEASEEINKRYAEQTSQLLVLQKRLESNKTTEEERKNIIDELNGKLKTITGTTLDYAASNEEVASALDKANEALLRGIKIDVYKEKLTELVEEELRLKDAFEEAGGEVRDGWYNVDSFSEVTKKLSRDINENREAQQALLNTLGNLTSEVDNVTESQEKLSESTGSFLTKVTKLNDKILKNREDQKKSAKEMADDMRKWWEDQYNNSVKGAKGIDDYFDNLKKQVANSGKEMQDEAQKSLQTAGQRPNIEFDITANKEALKWSLQDITSFAQDWFSDHKEEFDLITNTIGQGIDVLSEFSDARIAALDNELAAQGEAISKAQAYYDKQLELEESGLASNKDIAAQRLQTEKDVQAQLEAERKKAAKNAKLLAKGEATLNYISELGEIALYSAKNPTNALTGGASGAAILAIQSGLATARFVAGLATINAQKFALGTESVQGGQKGKDSVLSMLMPEERVVPVGVNKQLKGIANSDLPELVRKGMLLDSAIGGSADNKLLEAFSQFTNKQDTTNDILRSLKGWRSPDGKQIIDKQGNMIKRV